MTDDPDSCPSCDKDHTPDRPVTWSPTFGWLCAYCLASKTEAELRLAWTGEAG